MTYTREDLFAALSGIQGFPKTLTVGDAKQADEHDAEHHAKKQDAQRLFNAFPSGWPLMDAATLHRTAQDVLGLAVSKWGQALTADIVVDALQTYLDERAEVEEAKGQIEDDWS